MSSRSPIFFSALLLTGVNLTLRFVGTSFQIYISNQMGAAGIGLLQLVMSVGGFCMIAGMAGIRTGTMYLTAEEIGTRSKQNLPWILSGCLRYSILCSCTVSFLLLISAPTIAHRWISDMRTVPALRLYAAFLPVTCLCGVMTGLFTAANKIRLLAAVEILEQLLSISVTVITLRLWAGNDPGNACLCVILGSCVGACMTLVALALLYQIKPHTVGKRIPVRRRILGAAGPLAIGDLIKSGINTTENLMVPKRLAMNPAIIQPLAAFGTVTGMVFPVILFPACILFALAELLIPEFARCAASHSHQRIEYLTRRSLKIALLYGLLFGGLIYLSSETLCCLLYGNKDAVLPMQQYALLIPMLYCDTITDAITKGMGQQKICIRYNILTSALDVIFLYLLLPRYGMTGYYFSFVVTHLINFILSLRRLLRITEQTIPLRIPFLSIPAAIISATLSDVLPNCIEKIITFPALLLSILALLQVLGQEDIQWVRQLFSRQQNDIKNSVPRKAAR